MYPMWSARYSKTRSTGNTHEPCLPVQHLITDAIVSAVHCAQWTYKDMHGFCEICVWPGREIKTR